MATKKPKVTTGNHLTVTADANGRVSLEWDWDVLLEEVRAATGLIPVTEAKVTKTRATRKKKETT